MRCAKREKQNANANVNAVPSCSRFPPLIYLPPPALQISALALLSLSARRCLGLASLQLAYPRWLATHQSSRLV